MARERRNYDQAIIDLTEMVKIQHEDNRQLQIDLKDLRRINNELISVLGDVRDELQYSRTQRDRDERFHKLANIVKPKVPKAKALKKGKKG